MTGPTQDLGWLIDRFADRVPEVAHAIVVSADGLPLAMSSGFPPNRAEQLAAVTSGLASLALGASKIFAGENVLRTVVEMEYGVLLVTAVSSGASLAVLAGPDCALGVVAYEMGLLAERAGRMLTPAARAGNAASSAGRP
jgi:predicted regulator of Ras-like GTPase activity (Roadblock/LC7/MglB family)